MSQLGLDGTEVVHPVRHPRPLSDRQREVLRMIGILGAVRPLEVGKLMHAGARKHPAGTALVEGPCCQYASSDGCDALRRLERRGLVRRIHRGQWTLVDHAENW